MKKSVSEMNIDEILRKQMEILAEKSLDCDDEMLPAITNSLISLAEHLCRATI